MGLKMAFNGHSFIGLEWGIIFLNKMSFFGHKMNLFYCFDVYTLILHHDAHNGNIE